MSGLSSLRVAVAAVLAVGAAAAAAAPVTYTFTGIASGFSSLNMVNTAFSDQQLTVTIQADTTAIVQGNTLATLFPAQSNSIVVGSINDSIDQGGIALFSDKVGQAVGFGGGNLGDLITITSNQFVDYGLDTDIGPIGDVDPFFSQFTNVGLLGGGTLTLTSVRNAFFSADVQDVTAVPEPASLLLVAAGLLAMRSTSRGRRTV